MQDLLKRHLTKEGFRVVTTASGNDGVRLARELKPIAITLDVLMPSTDGWAVLPSLKNDPLLHDIPVIMLTMVGERESELGYRLGVAEYMTKPVKRSRLSEVLGRYRAAKAGPMVLLVEDDAETRRMTRGMLEREGWKVHEAENGLDGLRALAANRPDDILLDLIMPEVNGFELLDTLQETATYRDIPVVVLTSEALDHDKRRRLSGSVKQILAKGRTDQRRVMEEVRAIVAASSRARSAAIGTTT